VDDKYELYMEKFRITEWHGDTIYRTQTLGCDWFPAETIDGNYPHYTGFMYVAASDEFAQNNVTIRRAKT